MALLGDSKIVSLTLLDGVIGDLNPKTNNVYDLGTSSLKWRNIYGNLKGNADSATKATQDGNGKVISSTYLPLTGGTMTGKITAQAGIYTDAANTGALNMNNSNIYGVNAIYTADASDGAGEGINFYRDATHVDTLWMAGGNIYFVPNRVLGTSTSAADSQKVGRFTTTPTTEQIVVTDGTTGGIKTTGFTIAKSVPSDAKFTDTTYTNGSGLSLSGTTFSVATSGITNTMLAGSISNDKLTNSKITIAGNEVSLGGSISLDDLGIFLVTVTLTSLSTGTSDKTNTEIATAVSEGKIPFVSIVYGTAKMLAPLTFINSSEAVFTYENQADNDFTYATLTITNGNEASLIWKAKYFSEGSTYWGSELATTSAKYNANPEVASVIIGNGGNSNPSSKNVQLQYDDTLEVLNFIFA